MMSFTVPATQPTVVVPTVTTSAATQVTGTTATLNGGISASGGGSITDYGFYWGTSSSPSTQVSVGSGTTSSFSWNASVTPGTTYYFEAYATNQAGTGYGSVISFTVPATQPTVVAPSVTTSAATQVTSAAATLNGGISASGGGSITDYGFYWGTSSNPSTQVSVGSGATSSFSWNASVTPGTTYYFKAYATNQAGTGYGSLMSFSAPATQPTVLNTDPANNATGVDSQKIVTVTFNEPIQQGANWASITVYNKNSGLNVTDTNIAISGNLLTINSTDTNGWQASYTVTIPAGAVTDLSGNGLASDYSFSFTAATQNNQQNYPPANQGITVTLNNQPMSFDVPPVLENGRVLVPLRHIIEVLGATVQWDGETQTITATRGNTVILLQVGNSMAYINGSAFSLDVPPEIIDGRTLVPLRFISETFGCNVNWDGNTQTVSISTN